VQSADPYPPVSGPATAESLREQYGEPHPLALALERQALDAPQKAFIAAAPFLTIATCDEHGRPMVSPKGDAPGFVVILDDQTLLVPDRPGNNKIATLTNAAANSSVALLLFVPGMRETLRVEGSATVTLEPEHLELGRAGARLPPSALLIHVRRAYFHCGKALIRSKLWDPSRQRPPGSLPSLGQILSDQKLVDLSAADADAIVEGDYTDRLY
jgi:PPOX class probable FMN-dependent enzyme